MDEEGKRAESFDELCSDFTWWEKQRLKLALVRWRLEKRIQRLRDRLLLP